MKWEFKSDSWLWVALAYLPAFWIYSIPLTGDQKVYLSTALEMLEANSWAFPLIHGEHNYFKPPLTFWTLMGSWKAFGVYTFSTLIPSLLALFGTSVALNRISKRLGQPNQVAGLLFALSFGALTFGNSAQMEIWIAFFFCTGWLGFLEWQADRKSRMSFGLAFVSVALLALVKGPVHSALLLGGFFIFAWRQDRNIFRERRFYLGILFSVVLGAAWYGWVALKDFDRFYHTYYVRELIMKKGGNGVSVFEIWSALLLFVLPGLFWLRFNVRANSTLKTLMLAWIIPGGLFFSYFPYRVSTYLFFVAPVLCLWIALQYREWKMRSSAALAALILVPRLIGLGLGSEDLKDLRAFSEENPKVQIGFLDLDKFIWHEVGLVSIALHKNYKRLMSPSRAAEWVLDGGALVLSKEEFQTHEALLKQEIKARSPAPRELELRSWFRYPKRSELKTPEMLESLRAGDFWLERLKKREFLILRISESL